MVLVLFFFLLLSSNVDLGHSLAFFHQLFLYCDALGQDYKNIPQSSISAVTLSASSQHKVCKVPEQSDKPDVALAQEAAVAYAFWGVKEDATVSPLSFTVVIYAGELPAGRASRAMPGS